MKLNLKTWDLSEEEKEGLLSWMKELGTPPIDIKDLHLYMTTIKSPIEDTNI